MPESDFEAEILENEVVVTHACGRGPSLPFSNFDQRHSKHPRLPDRAEPFGEARRHLFDAHNAARVAFGLSQV
jgi:hypothetical protein